MRRLLVLLLVVAVLGAGAFVADLYLRQRAEVAVAQVVAENVPGSRGVRSAITAEPFVGRILVGRDVPQVVVTASSVAADRVTLRDVSLTVTHVVVDRGEALRGRLLIRSIGAGQATARVTLADLGLSVPGVVVDLLDGRADVQGPGGAKGALELTADGKVAVTVAGRTVFSVTVPAAGLLPCAPRAAIETGGLRLTCSFTEVPAALLQRARTG